MMPMMQKIPAKSGLWPLILVLLLFGWSGQALAGGADSFVKNHAERVLNKVLANKASLKANPDKLYAIIRSSVLPHVDFYSMSRSVLGKYWNQASGSQRNAFVREFRQLLVRTYGTALLNYSGGQIDYKPAQVSGKYAVVRTKVPRSGGAPVAVDYRLRGGGSSWKVVDIKVGGVSLVSNYRTSFGGRVGQIGVSGLIQEMKTKNR
ncbi:ABC transporter substrate-binding protein [Magnetovirga frankeli]|uniref:MlaC/ttg2D family ABC transporter substrate-binding protein n=1 Tax=Magnetovirga frankeli TaxID=947516 RepID=UPI001293ECD5|nr:ABC transporter substrate-binding protein [gamma proteobacterium SS-5]